MPPRASIIIEGWRNLAHSYSLVNTHQIGALLRRPGLDLFFIDAPPADPAWQPTSGLVEPALEAAVSALPPPPPGLAADAALRYAWPYRIADFPLARRTVVQATTEYGTVFDNFVAPLPGAGPDPVERALDRAMHACSAHVVTPSAWSREGFLRSGARAARVHVVPHGVNTARFRPRPAPERDALRARHGWTDDFVFLSIGAMTPNKNIDGLLRAFAAVLAKRPRARLALKGADHAFASGQKVRAALALIPPADAARAAARTTYIGSDLTIDELAGLYAAADAYAAPYRAEGFCLPALEAAACGLPLIVTRGGPTDDFTTGAFALPVKATKRHHPTDGWLMLEPDQRALEAQMLRAIDDATFRKSAATAGPAHAATFTWERAADQLLAVLLPDSPVP